MIRAALIVLLIAGCAPTPFELGREVSPPNGCIEARKVGHEC